MSTFITNCDVFFPFFLSGYIRSGGFFFLLFFFLFGMYASSLLSTVCWRSAFGNVRVRIDLLFVLTGVVVWEGFLGGDRVTDFVISVPFIALYDYRII